MYFISVIHIDSSCPRPLVQIKILFLNLYFFSVSSPPMERQLIQDTLLSTIVKPPSLPHMAFLEQCNWLSGS